jgi:GcrA cell cycle regulator
VDGPTLPPLISTVPLTVPAPAPAPIVLAPKPVAPPRVHAVPAPAPRPYGRIITCCWPIGEPGTRSFRFCDVGSVPGKPYCADHAQVAYVKIRDKREDAA